MRNVATAQFFAITSRFRNNIFQACHGATPVGQTGQGIRHGHGLQITVGNAEADGIFLDDFAVAVDRPLMPYQSLTTTNPSLEHLRDEEFDHIIIRSRIKCHNKLIIRFNSGEHDDVGVVVSKLGAQGLAEFNTIHARHAPIGDDHFRMLFMSNTQGLFPIFSGNDIKPSAEIVLKEVEKRGLGRSEGANGRFRSIFCEKIDGGFSLVT